MSYKTHYDKEEQDTFIKGISLDDDNHLDAAIVFCDIDGPLLDCRGRLVYIQDGRKDYDRFYGCDMANDTKHVLYSTATLAFLEGLISHYGVDYVKIVFNTTRPERTRAITELVLMREFTGLMTMLKGTQYDWGKKQMIMRRDHDLRPTKEVKLDNVSKWLLNAKSQGMNVEDFDLFVIDDNEAVLKMFDEKFTKKMEGTELDSILAPHTIRIGRYD